MNRDKPNGLPLKEAERPLPQSERIPEKQGSSAWIWIVVCCVIGLGGAFLWYRFAHDASTAQPQARGGAKSAEVPVVTALARKGDINIYLTGLGTVTAFNTVTVHTRVDGQIDKIFYKEGQSVKEGELLAQLDPRPFQAQLEQAQGQLARDSAQYQNAVNNLQRDKDAENAISKLQYDQDASSVDQYKGVVQSDQALVDTANLQIKYCNITAPISGWVGLRTIDAGNIVHANDQMGLVVITQLEPIAVIFSLPEENITAVLKKQRSGTPLEVDAYDRDLKYRLAPGTLEAVDNQIDQSTGTFRLKAKFENKDNALYPNQFVNARLLFETRADMVIVPTAAIQRSPDSSFVYIVKADNTVDMRTVIPGPAQGDETSIENGLAAGDMVVTDGVDKLTAGAKVVPHPMENKSTTQPGRGGRSGAGGRGDTTMPAGTTRPARGGRRGGDGAAGNSNPMATPDMATPDMATPGMAMPDPSATSIDSQSTAHPAVATQPNLSDSTQPAAPIDAKDRP